MKKGTLINVRDNAVYNGQDMSWTETFTGKKKIKAGGEWVTHTSQDLIKSFRPKKICVHPSKHSKSYFESNIKKSDLKGKYTWKTYIYSIFLPAGTIVETYSDDEYRFNLDNSFKIIYSGIRYETKGKSKISKTTGRMIDSYDYYSDTVKPK